MARNARERDAPPRSHIGVAAQQTHDSHVHTFGLYHRKWLFDEGYTDADVTNQFILPKVGEPLVKILEKDFQQLLAACGASQHPREYALRDRAMLWQLYDTGIRISERATLTFPQLDLRAGILVAHGKGDKERRIALGSNSIAAVRRYLDHARSAFVAVKAAYTSSLASRGR